MREIPLSGWIILCCFGVFFILINVGLWSAWRHRDTSQGEWLQRFTKGLSNPWEKEDSQLDELSSRVKHLKNESRGASSKDHPEDD